MDAKHGGWAARVAAHVPVRIGPSCAAGDASLSLDIQRANTFEFAVAVGFGSPRVVREMDAVASLDSFIVHLPGFRFDLGHASLASAGKRAQTPTVWNGEGAGEGQEEGSRRRERRTR